MEECLIYFRIAIETPERALSWEEWWSANEELVQRVFPLTDYVRLKHRQLMGARQILQKRGEIN